MGKKRYRDKKKEKEIARERINILFKKANESFKDNKSLSKRYVTLARKISTKIKVRIPSDLRRQYCKECGNYLMPGKNVRVRTTGKTITYYCLDCKKFRRIRYKK